MAWLILILLLILLIVVIYLNKKSNEPDLSVLPEQFIVFDLETTGLDPFKHEIIEIGAIKVNRGSSNHTTFQALIKPTKKITKRITEITGITQKMLDNEGEDLESSIKEFMEFIGDLRLVAYNAKFDMAFLKEAANKHNFTIKNPSSCALKMARRAFPGMKSYKLADLSGTGGLHIQGTHRALKDAELAMTVYASAASRLRSIK